MKKIVCLWLSVCLLLAACGQGTSSAGKDPSAGGPSWQEQYDLGVRYLSEGNYQEAIIAFTAAIEIDPKRAPAYVGRGDAHTGTAKLAAGDTAELPEEAVAAYESAVADYLAAIDLDDQAPEVYLKAAEVYVALGNSEAAIEILQRGIKAIGEQSLQDYLDELLNTGPVYLLMQLAGYIPDGRLWYVQSYQYDAQGFILAREDIRYRHDGSSESYVTTYEYTGEPGRCRMIRDRKDFDSEEEWLAAQREISVYPGYAPGFVAYIGETDGHYIIFANPLTKDTLRAEVISNNGVLNRDDYDTVTHEGWSYAVYTFDDVGNPISIATYNESGSIIGTAVLEWKLLEIADVH